MGKKKTFIFSALIVSIILVACGFALSRHLTTHAPFQIPPDTSVNGTSTSAHVWETYKKPDETTLHKTLTPLEYSVTQEEGTESPYSSSYDKSFAQGIYVDRLSGEPLFSSKDKYDSGTGWPSFVKPITPDAIVVRSDTQFFMQRTEVRSKYADSHLGHVFDDGPIERGGKRYCMNGAALLFIAKEDMLKKGYGEYVQYVN